ncbi:hypothetical protein RIF29_24119 [Crotalaria pallida]|uniref:RNase H type-1 domain-containing protein n=1 Tax=Crotalaria pallida TaxID=3830 RepID=A0AAN9EJ77_CROPI
MTVLGDEDWSFYIVVTFINNMFRDFNQSSLQSNSLPSHKKPCLVRFYVKKPCLVSWSKPPPQVWCINVDDSSLGNPGSAGFGGLICSEDGSWIRGFSGFIGFTTNLHAKLLAILHGLRLARNLQLQRVLCQTNSLEAIHLISSGNRKFHRYACFIYNICAFLEDWDVTLAHTLREGDQCADWLAKFGTSN